MTKKTGTCAQCGEPCGKGAVRCTKCHHHGAQKKCAGCGKDVKYRVARCAECHRAALAAKFAAMRAAPRKPGLCSACGGREEDGVEFYAFNRHGKPQASPLCKTCHRARRRVYHKERRDRGAIANQQ